MSISLGIVMDPISKIKISKDSSFALLLEAQRRGYNLYYFEMNDLFLRDGVAYGRGKPLEVMRDSRQWFSFSSERDMPLHELDVMLMRKDPPFDLEYIYATYLLELAQQRGVYVVNRPASLRDANEKLFIAWFPQCCAPTLVTRSSSRIRSFLHEQGEIVIKPLDGMGGASIFRVARGDMNLSVILETMTQHDQRFVMVQRYLPAISEGDKRILVINGEPVPYALARIPAEGESRGNLAAGGRAEGRPLTERDRWIVSQVGPVLRERGLVLTGIDVIGDCLTEINVTSPTCIQELDAAFGLNISAMLMDHIETVVGDRAVADC